MLLKTGFRIVSWNAYSLSPRLAELIQFIEQESLPPEIICLQETWVYEECLPDIEGYSYVHTFRDNKKGGGSAIYVINSIDYCKLNNNIKLSDIDVEVSGIQLLNSINEPLVIFSVYIAPSQILKSEHLSGLIGNKNTIIVGDFNAKSPLWGSPMRDARGKVIEQFVEDNDLICLNKGYATRINYSGTLSHLDLVLCSSNLGSELNTEIHDDSWGSDHLPLITTFDSYKYFINVTNHIRFNYKKANWDLFQSTLQNDETLSYPIINSEEAYDRLINAYLNAKKVSIPYNKGPAKHRYSPFWNNECSEAKRNRKNAEKILRKSYSLENLINYKKLKSVFRLTFEKYKKLYWEKYCASLNYNSKTSSVWKAIKNLKNNDIPSNKSSNIFKGISTDNKSLADNFAEVFRSVSSDQRLTSDILNTRSKTVSNVLNSFTKNEELNNITSLITDSKKLNIPFIISELDSVLSKVNIKSAPGLDEIPYSFIINSPVSTKHFLINFINNIWSTGKIPNNLKHSIIKPILKPNKNKTDLNSYRPISLTSSVSKIMEKMIGNRLNWYLVKNKLLNPNQAGFRKFFCTNDPIIRLKHEAEVAVNSGSYTIAIMIDFTRAFDLLWTDGLILKLMQLKITGNMLNWIRNFLKDRICQVKIGDTLSNTFCSENGTPQGSAISPLLFLIMINDFPKLSSFTSDSFFADDSTIWRSGNNFPQITFHLQKDLDTICEWCKKWGFMINTEKTTGIIFSKNKPKNINVNLVINGKPIIMKDNCKLLGVTFDSHLTWNAHIEELENKTNKNLNIMRCISGTNWGASKSILLTIYKALILSHIDYCCFVYNDCSPTLKRKVDTIQYKSLLLAVGAMKGTALKALLGECGEIPLELRRKKLILKYLLKIYTNPSNAASLVLQDKKFFNLGLNCKSPYQLLLHTFLNDTGIELEIEDIEHKITPWFEINYQIDLELLNILPSINDIFLRNSVIDNKLLELTSKYSHLIFVDGSVTKDSKAGAAIFSPSLSLNTNYKLPDALPIYYVEAFAILKALEYASSVNLHNICIISDCSRVLQDIKNVSQNLSPHPKLISNICIILNSLNDILLSWFRHCSNSNILLTD